MNLAAEVAIKEAEIAKTQDQADVPPFFYATQIRYRADFESITIYDIFSSCISTAFLDGCSHPCLLIGFGQCCGMKDVKGKEKGKGKGSAGPPTTSKADEPVHLSLCVFAPPRCVVEPLKISSVPSYSFMTTRTASREFFLWTRVYNQGLPFAEQFLQKHHEGC